MQGKLEDLLFELEEQFWLRGADYHERHLADAVVMVFPGSAGVMVKDEIVRSLATQPRWTRVALEEHRAQASATSRARARRTSTMDGAGVSHSTSRRRSDGVSQDPRSPASPSIHPDYQERSLLGRGTMLKVLGWIVLIIFLIGLLVVIGVFDLIF